METLNMEDHPKHWESTLLGDDFWQEAEADNQPIHDDIEARENQLLHTRFPFNIDQERGPRPQVPIEEQDQGESTDEVSRRRRRRRRRRPFSMSDALLRTPLNFQTNLELHSNRILGFPRQFLALSSASVAPSVSPQPEPEINPNSESEPEPEPEPQPESETLRSRSRLGFSLNMSSFKKRGNVASKAKDDGKENNDNVNSIDKKADASSMGKKDDADNTNKKNDAIESVLSTTSPQEPGTPANPLMYFRGGASWNCLPRDMQAMGLDLFWPVKKENARKDYNKEVLDIEELQPLCQFRHLRVLKITGMMQSYQKYIWQAAWLNTELEELELGMAIAPRIRRDFKGHWPSIKGSWNLSKDTYGEPIYYGHMGSGKLKRTIGIGEYLDKIAIEKAKICAMTGGRTRNRLSIKTLTLNGFVVDADPFLLWFDTKRLRCINFQDNCIDAGFYLCLPMSKVTVRYPRDEHEKAMTVRRVDLKKELKVVELKGGKKIGEVPYRGPETLNENIVGKCDKQAEKDLFAQRIGGLKLDSKENTPVTKDDKKDAVVEVSHKEEFHESSESEGGADEDSLAGHEDFHIYRHEMF